MQPILDDIKPELFPPEPPSTELIPDRDLEAPLYIEYRCPNRNPLNCTFPQQTVQEDEWARSCLQCGFPATLPPKTKLKGHRGTYTIEHFRGRRGIGRLYQGTQLEDNQTILIKEFLLPPKVFNAQESSQRKAAFISLGGLNLADGRVQDFRLICPWEAIADPTNPAEERCYLITKTPFDRYPTLSHHLATQGAMTPAQVQQVLNQVLQTLEFLHEQKFSLPSGQIQQGIAHGNLNLHSLLIDETSFFIYLCDLALWERIFDPPLTLTSKPTPADDLVALGQIAFSLLLGSVADASVDPSDQRQWPPTSLLLQEFILRLMGRGMPFESAHAARQALLKLPPEQSGAIASLAVTEEASAPIKVSRTPWIIFGTTLGLLLLTALIGWIISQLTQENAPESEFLVCCIKDVPPLPKGKFSYGGEADGTWTYILQKPNLIAKDKTLETELQKRLPNTTLLYQPIDYEINPSAAKNAVIEQIRSGKINFAITTLIDQQSDDLTYQTVAYDGLVVFVNFSYSRRKESLPNALKGQITFEQLRQLYTGQITNWQQLGGPDLPVKLYIPTETEAIQIFEQRVLKDQAAIEAFRKLWQKNQQQPDLSQNILASPITQLPTFATLRAVIKDFEEDEAGGIAFGTLSKVFGQCSAYPLAVVEEKTPIQPLIQNNGSPIDPTTDLCNNKGSYFPNVQLFNRQQYPLSYPVAVVYPKDNRRATVGAKFVNILKTQESQRLLNKTGLVPLQPLPRK